MIRQAAAAFEIDLSKTKVEPRQITFYCKEKGKTIVFPTDEHGMIDNNHHRQSRSRRRAGKFRPFKLVRVWSMGIALAAAELRLDLEHPDVDLQNGLITLHGANGLSRSIPVDGRGYFYIDWSIGLKDPRLAAGPFEDLLQAQVDRAAGKTGHESMER